MIGKKIYQVFVCVLTGFCLCDDRFLSIIDLKVREGHLVVIESINHIMLAFVFQLGYL